MYENIGNKKIHIIILTLIQMVLGVGSVLVALIMKKTVDYAVSHDESMFFKYFLCMGGVVLLQITLRAVNRFLEEYVKAGIENVLKLKLFSSLLQKDYSQVTAVHSAEWMNRLTSDTAITSNYVVDILPNLAGMLIKLIFAMIAILYLQPKFAYILIPGGMVMILFTYGFRRISKRLHKNVQERDGDVRIFLQEHLGNLMMIHAFGVERRSEEQSFAKMNLHKKARMKKNHFSNICNIGFAVAINGIYIAGFGYCGYGILHGTISYGTLIAITQLIGQIQTPFANITGYIPKFYAMCASVERLMETENYRDDYEKIQGDADVEVMNDFEKIKLNQVSFAYSEEREQMVLENCNLEFEKGKFIAFTGISGCGKSTIFKLLLSLYEPLSGNIEVCSQTGTYRISPEFRRLFAYVPQGNKLMTGTIEEVITFGATETSEEKIISSLYLACAEFVFDLPEGIHTMLGEQGAGLSEGQMQRIAIARALYADRKIILLDESTSALDEDTEKRVLTNIRALKDKTVFIVTHRPAALKICDNVVKL